MTEAIIEVIRNIGAKEGDVIYIRSITGTVLPGVQLTTATDLLRLKLEAVEDNRLVVATGPATDESFADFVIDADLDEPAVVKRPAPASRNGVHHPTPA